MAELIMIDTNLAQREKILPCEKGTATMDMGFIVHGREELNRVIKKLRQIENVIDIERTTG